MLMSPPKTTERCVSVLTLAALFALQAMTAAAAPPAPPDPAERAFRNMLMQRYPHTQFGDIQQTPMPGIWEVWMGANVAYVTDEGRHFIFGHLYDMQTQADLTAAKKELIASRKDAIRPRISFVDLPLADAIKTVRGSGRRKLAVFSDPHCGYCRVLEGQLSKLDNVTVYTFLYPIDSIHPQATADAEAIWCAKDRAAAWSAYMRRTTLPQVVNCASPIERNIQLATGAGVTGTPFIFFDNGKSAAGALDSAELERHLGAR
jgi:thiol:disulfide interchange protein DsbC